MQAQVLQYRPGEPFVVTRDGVWQMNTPPPPDNMAECRRMTRDGRILTYRLTVMQQPEKARACGSGAKACADRRPVDPPPIIELRIFEGHQAQNDITFAVNSNLFLFVSLEHARASSQGRMTTDSRGPILTGVPVSGLVYLDRPRPAGYFLFPDLSVRHEGKYILNFNLYEEIKNPRDEDISYDGPDNSQGSAPCVIHRLSVKSKEFTVYSAKKFPGLNQSTELSRTVAEQGCRVRIRRDARSRKNIGKDSSDDEREYDKDSRPSYDAGNEQAHRSPAEFAAPPQQMEMPSASHSYPIPQSMPGPHTLPHHIGVHRYEHDGPPASLGAYPPMSMGPVPNAGHYYPTAAYPSHAYPDYNLHAGFQQHQPQVQVSQRFLPYNPVVSGPSQPLMVHNSPSAYRPGHERHWSAHDAMVSHNEGLFNEVRHDSHAGLGAANPGLVKSEYAPYMPPVANTPRPTHLQTSISEPSLGYGIPRQMRGGSDYHDHERTLTPPSAKRVRRSGPDDHFGPPLLMEVNRNRPSIMGTPVKRARGQIFDTSNVRGQLQPTARPCPDLSAYARKSPEPTGPGLTAAPLEVSYKRADGRNMMRNIHLIKKTASTQPMA